MHGGPRSCVSEAWIARHRLAIARGQDLPSWVEACRLQEPRESLGLGLGMTYSFGLVFPIKSKAHAPEEADGVLPPGPDVRDTVLSAFP